MAAEFYVSFRDTGWLPRHAEGLSAQIRMLPTFSKTDGREYWLQGFEDRAANGRWTYDVRIFLQDSNQILLELSSRPPSIQADLLRFLSWLRSRTEVSVTDEDGEPIGW